MSDKFSGKLADPEFRRERARKGALARNSLDSYIKSIVDRAPELTDTQKSTLRTLLGIASGGQE